MDSPFVFGFGGVLVHCSPACDQPIQSEDGFHPGETEIAWTLKMDYGKRSNEIPVE
jgi:hypothetical protein